jgi:hypothetical protein
MQQSYQILSPRGQAELGGRLKLCNTPPQIYQVLSMAGFLMNVPTYESADIAVHAFGK